MKSLIAEDDMTSRFILQEILTPLGEVTAVADGEEAIKEFEYALQERAPYDLVCLDITMPKKDGFVVLRHIRRLESGGGIASEQRTKVIMITAAADKENVATALKEKCNGYLVKPVNGAKLVKKIQVLGLAS